MTAIKIQFLATRPYVLCKGNPPVYPTEGCHIMGTGKVAGLFRSVEDAIAGDGYEEAIIAWDKLTREEQAVATANSEWLAAQ